MARVAILGTGLIGTSIALRLQEQRHDLDIVGFDSSRDSARAAEKRKAFRRIERTAVDAVEGAVLVILAAPILAIRDLMRDVAGRLPEGVVVTDTGSTKAQVLRWAEELLPDHVEFVGGHPMAGKTQHGPGAADPALFEDRPWVVVPPARASHDAVDTVAGLGGAMGARPTFMDAEEHDAYVAAISHVPMLAAGALFRLARDSEAWPELSVLASTGFRDTTRLAATDELMAHDIALTNRDQIVHWLQRYRGLLYDLEDRLRDVEQEEQLLRYFTQLNVDYLSFLDGAVGRVEIDQKKDFLPDVSMTDLMMGNYLQERLRQMTERSQERIAEAEERRRFGGR